MAGFIEGVQRSQTVLFPDRLEDWIGEDDLVRVVDLFVEELDLPGLGFVRSAPARTATSSSIATPARKAGCRGAGTGSSCQTCPVKGRCSTSTERRIIRWENEHRIEAMQGWLGRDPDPMTLRRCTVERPFGTIKGRMGYTRFLTRRLKNVRTEMALNVLTCNVRRMIALVGIRGLMAAIPGWNPEQKPFPW